jgi:hypothetical protein
MQMMLTGSRGSSNDDSASVKLQFYCPLFAAFEGFFNCQKACNLCKLNKLLTSWPLQNESAVFSGFRHFSVCRQVNNQINKHDKKLN